MFEAEPKAAATVYFLNKVNEVAFGEVKVPLVFAEAKNCHNCSFH